MGKFQTTRRVRCERTDYGFFRFHAIDFVDSIHIQESLMRTTWNIENVERNQCVLPHLEAGMLWSESGRSMGLPGRCRACALTQELRRLDLINASLARGELKDASTLEITIVVSNAHEVAHPYCYRCSRTLGFSTSSVLLGLRSVFLRAFDVGRVTDGYDVSAHLFPNSVRQWC